MNGLITKNKRLKQDPGLYIINNRFETGVYIKYRVFPHKLSPDVQLQRTALYHSLGFKKALLCFTLNYVDTLVLWLQSLGCSTLGLCHLET